MTTNSHLIDQGPAIRLGSPAAPLLITEGERATGVWRGRRYLTLAGKPAFELSYWCGTCPFTFERMTGANQTFSAEDLQGQLNKGLTAIDPTILNTLSALVPEGEYLPLLLKVWPRLVTPMQPGDYFSEEQVATWGVDSFWGLPEYPRTPYYRTTTRSLGPAERLFEFVVPMVPPNWNSQEKVAGHAKQLAVSSTPTCLALSILDICQPATGDTPESQLTHWALAHFLLDGHHKMQAAAETGRPLRLLSLLSLSDSLAQRADLLTIPSIFAESTTPLDK